MALPFGITNTQLLYFVVAILILWRLNQLPAIIAQQLDTYIPSKIAQIIKGN